MTREDLEKELGPIAPVPELESGISGAESVDENHTSESSKKGEQEGGSPADAPATAWKWEDDEHNPYNWPKGRKSLSLAMTALVAFVSSLGTSILSPAHNDIMAEYGVSSTVAFLPLSMYVLALGLGPSFGGPLSETAGRKVVYYMAVILGGLFVMAAGLVHDFAGLVVLRFLSGFFYGPSLAVGAGVLNEIYLPMERGGPSAIFILSPFLGPGLGPVLGVFLVDRLNWRWTQYIIAFGSVLCLALVIFAHESYHSVVQRRRMAQLSLASEPRAPFSVLLRKFLTVGLLRPLHMLATEPIVGFTGLFIATMFGTLFMFFGSLFYVFQATYRFTLEQSGLVFLAIALGCLFGTITVGLCDKLLYQKKARALNSHYVPPEYRLYPAMIGSVLLPISLFWFGWTSQAAVNPAVPIIAIVLFGWGNIALFISCMQYLADTYHRTNVASATSANSLARYTLAAVFPFFSLQMYQNLGSGWATSILAFIALALAPVPFALYKWGSKIRSMSKYETASY